MEPGSAHRNAHEDLQYIRRTLAAAGNFSSLSGTGMVVTGVLALATVVANLRLTGAPWDPGASPDRSLGLWGVLLVVSIAIGVWTSALKARRTGQVFWSPVLRKALWGYAAGMALGAILTVGAIRTAQFALLPEIWLGCYGAAMTAAGVMTVPAVRWMGISFLALAAVAAWVPPGAQILVLGLGFGWLHIAFGAFIAWRHNG